MSAQDSFPGSLEVEPEDEEEESEEESEESESETPVPPPIPQIVGDRFLVKGKIGSGSYSDIYQGCDQKTDEEVAVKVEWHYAEKGDKLLEEANFYQSLGKVQSMGRAPNIRWSGTVSEYNLMVMDLLGPSIDELFKDAGRFSLKTVLMLGEQIIDCLESVHESGILYRDIKPHNFLMGLGENAGKVYIVDFGLAKRYLDKHNEHISCSSKKRRRVTGTVRYSSLNVHAGLDASRRDDLEAVGYMLVHWLKGELPWLGLKPCAKKTKHEVIGEKKLIVPDAELCEGLPGEFAEYFKYCRELEFAEKPDYARLRGLMRAVFEEKGYQTDFRFDWMTGVVSDVPRPCKTLRNRSGSPMGRPPRGAPQPKKKEKRRSRSRDRRDRHQRSRR